MQYARKDYVRKMLSRRDNGLIKVITGARRAGKSFLMNVLFRNALLDEGIDDSHIIRFAFDTDEYLDILDQYLPDVPTKIYLNKNSYIVNAKKFRQYIASLTDDKGKYYLLLDEVQLLDGFVSTLNGFLRHSNLDVYVTGSNSRFLSKDIVTEFKGRGSVIHVLPLTFDEYYSDSEKTPEECWKRYLETGGLPVVANMNDREEQIEYLINLCSEVYIKDIIERNNLQNSSVLSDLFDVVSSSIGTGVNPTKLVNTFKSVCKKDVSDDTLRKYLDCMEDAFLISKVRQYNISGRKYINSPYKIYFEDVGVRNARINFKRIEEGHLLENIVYNDLRYRGFQVEVGVVDFNEITDRLNANNKYIYIKNPMEVDFIATKGNERYYIQVCLNLSTEEIINREKRPLNRIHDSFKKIIITKDGLGLRRDETGIIIVDLFDYLLNKETVLS